MQKQLLSVMEGGVVEVVVVGRRRRRGDLTPKVEARLGLFGVVISLM